MKTFLLFTMALVCLATFAQNPTLHSTLPSIYLEGHASVKVIPDMAVINFTVNEKDKLENIVLTKLNTKTNNLLDKIFSLGFTKEQVRISNFSIQEEYAYTGGVSRKVGYIASQTLVLRFTYDKEKLTRLFTKLSAEQTGNININFGTELSTSLEKMTRDKLIEMAIEDARQKSELIARAAKLRITGIQKIEYGAQAPPITYMRNQAYETESKTMNSTPVFNSISAGEIELTERISIAYLVEAIK